MCLSTAGHAVKIKFYNVAAANYDLIEEMDAINRQQDRGSTATLVAL